LSDDAYRFRFPFRVRYSEIDGQGIVFNAHYLTYFDTAITEYFRDAGYDYKAECGRQGCDFHTVKSLIEYKAPIRFDELVDVGVRTGRLGRTSIRFDLEIRGRHEGETDRDLRATGEIVWVYTDQTTHRPTALPETLIAALNRYEDPNKPG